MRLPSFLNMFSGRNAVSKNVALLGLIRGGNILVQLLLIPLSIRFVSSEYFGFWLTLSSAVTWLNILDLGLSNGLRNKLAVAIIRKDFYLGRKLVSTTYFFLAVIALLGIGISLCLMTQVNWSGILTVPERISRSELIQILSVVIVSFFINFLLKPVFAVAYAFHKPFVEPLISFLGGILNAIIILLFLQILGKGEVLTIALVFCFTPILVNLVLSVVYYVGPFRTYSPGLRHIDLKLIRPLFSLSSKFFIIQIAATLVLTTTNFIISKFFGNEAVTDYNIVQRYFGSIIILQSMVLTPFWNLITDAYERQDVDWLKKTMGQLLKMNVVFSLVIVLMALFSPLFFSIWIGTDFQVPVLLNYFFAAYTIMFLFTGVFTTFINGTGKVKLQMLTSIFTCCLYIPLVLVLIKYFDFGTVGVIAAATFWAAILFPFRFIQYLKLLQFNHKNSIWNS